MCIYIYTYKYIYIHMYTYRCMHASAIIYAYTNITHSTLQALLTVPQPNLKRLVCHTMINLRNTPKTQVVWNRALKQSLGEVISSVGPHPSTCPQHKPIHRRFHPWQLLWPKDWNYWRLQPLLLRPLPFCPAKKKEESADSQPC